MIKLLVLTQRARGVSRGDYEAYWTGAWRAAARTLPGLRQYRQCISAGLDKGPFGSISQFDGMDEYWFDDVAAAKAIRPILDAMPDAAEISSEASLRMVVREHVIIPGFAMRPGTDVRLTYFWRHRPDLTAEAARDHWYTCHAPLVPGTPGVIRHVQGHPLAVPFDDELPFWTGVSELWFRSLDVFPQFESAPQMAEQGVDGQFFSDFNFVENYITLREDVVL